MPIHYAGLPCKINEINSSILKLNVLDQEVEIDFETSFNLNKDESYFLGIRPRSFEITDHNSSNTFLSLTVSIAYQNPSCLYDPNLPSLANPSIGSPSKTVLSFFK